MTRMLRVTDMACDTDSAENLAPAIATEGLTKVFGERAAVRDVSFEIPAGAFLSVFGHNGAGKSTLLDLLATLTRPTSGSLRIFGTDVTEDADALRPRIGIISHRPMVYGDLTALENLVFFARLYGVANPEDRAVELLRLVELDHRRHDRARTFSRGMTQRLSIARALINDPDLVLLDEPYSGLDPHAAQLFDDLIARVREGRTFVMVSHDLSKGFELCTHALIMAEGQVVTFGNHDDYDPETFRGMYLSAIGSR